MNAIGVDLAWTSSNETGLAAIKDGELEAVETGVSDREIVEFVERHSEGETKVAVDAPLVVPNETGQRPAEDEIGEEYSENDAGAFPANRNWLSQWEDRVRGEDLVNRLKGLGFEQDPRLNAEKAVFEVYPHAAIVELFGLDEVLRYKKKSGRSYEKAWSEMERFQDYLKSLQNPSIDHPVLEKDVEGLKGRKLKNVEDRLDAVLCAYLGVECFQNGLKVFGSLEEGYIVNPHQSSLDGQSGSMHIE